MLLSHGRTTSQNIRSSALDLNITWFENFIEVLQEQFTLKYYILLRDVNTSVKLCSIRLVIDLKSPLTRVGRSGHPFQKLVIISLDLCRLKLLMMLTNSLCEPFADSIQKNIAFLVERLLRGV